MEYTISRYSSNDPWDEWYESERGSGLDDVEPEEGVDDMIEDCYDDEDE